MHPKHAAQSDRAVMRVNYRMATFSVDDYKRPFPSRREKEISKVLSEAYDSVVLTGNWPRSVIDVHVELFQSDGGTRTAAAIAITAALADAGLPMRDLTGGIASGLYEDHVCLDLTGHEDMKGEGDMPILYSPALDEVSLFQLDGKFTFDQFKEAFYTSIDGVKEIVEIIKGALKDKYLSVREEYGVDDSDDDEEEVQAHLETTEEPEVIDEGREIDIEEIDLSTSSFVVGTVKPVTEEAKTQEPPAPAAAAVEEVTEPEAEEIVESIHVDDFEKEESSEPEEVASEADDEVLVDFKEDDEISSTWFAKPGAELKPMPANETVDDEDETENVMRDIEYTMEDEE
jgi:exosome complex component RRP41